MPTCVKVSLVHTEEQLSCLHELIGKPFVGLDSEWRPQMTKFETLRPSLLQLSDET